MRANASIIPLDYGTHMEFSVFIFDPIWSNLVDLLSDAPGTLFAWGSAAPPLGPGQRWAQAPVPTALLGSPLVSSEKTIPWQLNSPATAVIRPIFDRPDLAPLISTMAGQVNVRENVSYETYSYVSSAKATPDFWKSYILAAWETVFSEGFYIVEFAVDTAMLFITYLPPLKPVKLYKKSYSPITVATIVEPPVGAGPNPLTNQLATVHFDLADLLGNTKDMTMADRACFMVDQISNRAEFVLMLNMHKDYLVGYQLVPEGGNIVMSTPAAYKTPAQNDLEFRLQPVFPAHPGVDFPTVTIEGLSSDALVDTCCVLTTDCIVVNGKIVVTVRDTAGKDYPPDSS